MFEYFDYFDYCKNCKGNALKKSFFRHVGSSNPFFDDICSNDGLLELVAFVAMKLVITAKENRAFMRIHFTFQGCGHF